MERLDFIRTWLSPKVSGISKWPTPLPMFVKIKLTLNPFPYYFFTIFWEIKIIGKTRHTFFVSSDFNPKDFRGNLRQLLLPHHAILMGHCELPQLHLLHFSSAFIITHMFPTTIPFPLSWKSPFTFFIWSATWDHCIEFVSFIQNTPFYWYAGILNPILEVLLCVWANISLLMVLYVYFIPHTFRFVEFKIFSFLFFLF